MDHLLDGLKDLMVTKGVIIDDMVFRLHYRLTFAILLLSSLLVTARQFFGDPIECIVDGGTKDEVLAKVVTTYCWVHSTFSVDSAWKKEVGLEVPYPGIDKYVSNESRTFHAYYQWVFLVLFVQALFFYAPRLIWKWAEGGRVKALTQGLNALKNRTLLVKYIRNSRPLHNQWFFIYVVLEVINFLNVIIQAIIIDRFLGNEFLTYGLDVLKFTDWDWTVRYDPMLKVFPRLTKCTFRQFGPSGDVEKLDSLCLLPINIVNEKIYIFLWFWFCFLAVISLLGLVYRLATLASPLVRQMITYLGKRMIDSDSMGALNSITRRQSWSTWFFLDILSKNIEAHNFEQLLIELNRDIMAHKRAKFECKQV